MKCACHEDADADAVAEMARAGVPVGDCDIWAARPNPCAACCETGRQFMSGTFFFHNEKIDKGGIWCRLHGLLTRLPVTP